MVDNTANLILLILSIIVFDSKGFITLPFLTLFVILFWNRKKLIRKINKIKSNNKNKKKNNINEKKNDKKIVKKNSNSKKKKSNEKTEA